MPLKASHLLGFRSSIPPYTSKKHHAHCKSGNVVKRRLFRNQEGSAAIEFALIAPAMFLLLLGIIEISMAMFASSVLENATTFSSRIGRTGYSDGTTSREEMILDLVRRRSHGLLDPSKVTVQTRVYDRFNEIGTAEPLTKDVNGNGSFESGDEYEDINGNGQWDEDMARSGAGEQCEVVVYTVRYPWQITAPIIKHMMPNDGQINLTSYVVVRNEPFAVGLNGTRGCTSY